MRDVRPFFVPAEGSVRPRTWQRRVDTEWVDLEGHLEDWDQLTTVRVRSVVEFDEADLRRAAGVEDGSPLQWVVGWQVTDTRLVTAPVRIELSSSPITFEFDIDPDRAGPSVRIFRRLVLRRDRSWAAPGQPSIAGSILWSDEVMLRLTGTGAAFPTEVVAFDKYLPRIAGASWFLHLPTSVDSPAMGSMTLMLNAADKTLVAAVSAAKPTELQKQLVDTMEEGVVEELVRWCLSRWDEMGEVETESVGEMATILTRRVLSEPEAWTSADVDSMELRSAIVDGARRIGRGRALG